MDRRSGGLRRGVRWWAAARSGSRRGPSVVAVLWLLLPRAGEDLAKPDEGGPVEGLLQAIPTTLQAQPKRLTTRPCKNYPRPIRASVSSSSFRVRVADSSSTLSAKRPPVTMHLCQ